jgi:hypothetical protein
MGGALPPHRGEARLVSMAGKLNRAGTRQRGFGILANAREILLCQQISGTRARLIRGASVT